MLGVNKCPERERVTAQSSEQGPVSERAERDGTKLSHSPDISQWAVSGDWWLLSSGPPLAQITPAKLSPALQPWPGRHRLYAVDVYKPPGQCWPPDSVTWAIMTSRHTNIRLLFSLGAALPFSQDPVFTWSASLACGHFLGHLFRHLAGAGHQDEVEEARDDGDRPDSREQVVATPTPEPCQRQRRPDENTPRGRMVRNTRQRMQDKRQKHLRGSFQKLRDKNWSEPAEPVPDYRGILPVTEDRLLSEAARTLDNICSDYLCSLERKKVTN